MRNKLLILAVAGVITACGTTPQQSQPLTENDSVPSWVLQPIAPDDGLASSSCVVWTGNMAISRAQAITNARADIATQISTKAQVMDTLINKKTQQQDSTTTNLSFTQISKQVAEQSLVGAIAKEIGFARLDGKKQLCALVTMENTKPLFDKLIETSGKNLSPNDEDMLYREFRLKTTTDELKAQDK